MSERRRPPRAGNGVSGGAASWHPGKSSVRASALSLVVLLSSCLVTNKVDYDQLIIPSRVKRVEPPTEFSPLPVEADEGCERLGRGYMRFAVEVSDLNLEEELRLRVVVNKELRNEFTVTPNGQELRELDDPFFCVEARHLTQPCNLVEAVVSSSFRGLDPYGARLGERDLASAHWWVLGKAEDNPNASYFDCPDPSPDAGAP